jgi:hydroxymethylpyrimidine/phosphomethylpyrimidine kinase
LDALQADAAQTLACQIRDEVNGQESRREDFDDIQPECVSSLLKDKERNRTGGCSMDISSLTEMTVEQLKNALKERGLLTTGLKEELVERLEAFLGSENKQVKHTMQHVGKLWQEVYVNKLRRYRGFFKPKWLLMPHPKLRNQSPIRAIQSDEGRALLDQLLKRVGPSVAAKTLRRFWLRRSEIPFLAAHVSSFSRHSLSPPLLVVPYRICTIPITYMLQHDIVYAPCDIVICVFVRNFEVWNKIIQPRVGGAVILQACLRRREQQIHMLELSRVFPEFERGVLHCGEDILSAKRLQLLDWGAQVMQSWLRRRTGQMMRDLMIQHLVSAKFLQNVLRCKFIAEKAKTFALALKTVCAAQILQFYLRHKGEESERILHVLSLQREKCCIIVHAALRRNRGQAEMKRRILELERLQGAMILQAAVCREKHQRGAGCAKSAAKILQYYLRHKGAESERWLHWEKLLQELALQREKCCIIVQAALRRNRGQAEMRRRILEWERLQGAMILQAAVCREKHQRGAGCAKSAAKILQNYLRHKGAESERWLHWERLLQELALQREKCCIIVQAALRRNRGQAEMRRRILEWERLQGAMILQAAVCREKHQRGAGCAKSAAKKLQNYLRHKGAESERRLNWLALRKEKSCVTLQARIRQAIIRVEAPDGLRDARRDYERHQKALKETKRITRVLRFVRALPDDICDDLFWQSMVVNQSLYNH